MLSLTLCTVCSILPANPKRSCAYWNLREQIKRPKWRRVRQRRLAPPPSSSSSNNIALAHSQLIQCDRVSLPPNCFFFASSFFLLVFCVSVYVAVVLPVLVRPLLLFLSQYERKLEKSSPAQPRRCAGCGDSRCGLIFRWWWKHNILQLFAFFLARGRLNLLHIRADLFLATVFINQLCGRETIATHFGSVKTYTTFHNSLDSLICLLYSFDRQMMDRLP